MAPEIRPKFWNKEFLIGDSLLDYEHKIIFALIDNCLRLSINGGTKNQILEILRILKSYLVYHFSNEEKVMEEFADGSFQLHRGQHNNLLIMLNGEIEKLVNDHRSLTGQQVAYWLHDWYVEHLKQEDKKLVH